MKLTDCKPGMLVWWRARNGMHAAEIVHIGMACVTIRYWDPQWEREKSVSPKNLYPRTT